MLFAAQGNEEPFVTWGARKLVCKLTRGSAHPKGPAMPFQHFIGRERFFFSPLSRSLSFSRSLFSPFLPAGFKGPRPPPPPAPAARCPAGADRLLPAGSCGGSAAEQRREDSRGVGVGVQACVGSTGTSAQDKAPRGCGRGGASLSLD